MNYPTCEKCGVTYTTNTHYCDVPGTRRTKVELQQHIKRLEDRLKQCQCDPNQTQLQQLEQRITALENPHYNKPTDNPQVRIQNNQHLIKQLEQDVKRLKAQTQIQITGTDQHFPPATPDNNRDLINNLYEWVEQFHPTEMGHKNDCEACNGKTGTTHTQTGQCQWAPTKTEPCPACQPQNHLHTRTGNCQLAPPPPLHTKQQCPDWHYAGCMCKE